MGWGTRLYQGLIQKGVFSHQKLHMDRSIKSLWAYWNKARNCKFTNKHIYKDATISKLNLVTVNMPEENYLKNSIINVKESSYKLNRDCVSAFFCNLKCSNCKFWIILASIKDYFLNQGLRWNNCNLDI